MAATPLEDVVAALRQRFERAGDACELHTTHISIVLLAGEYAYKFKRPVDFGFVDFSTLELRRHFCAREIELNRRTAPDIYLRVAAVTVDDGGPVLDGPGEPVEYAVVMRRFEQRAIFDAVVERGEASAGDFSAFGADLARLHAAAPAAAAGSAFGTAELVSAQVLAAFDHLDVPGSSQLKHAVAARLEALRSRFRARKGAGFIRECHGDLHLGNVLLDNGRATPFDCIEFNDDLRVIDTMSDLAFLVMDLDCRKESRFANVLLNAYLDASGDFAGLSVLTLYVVYRALVRAKVAELQRLGAKAHGDAPKLAARRDGYLGHARASLEIGPPPGLVITHGVSGSGKSHHSRALAARTGFIHLRSDRERRRLAGRTSPPPGRVGVDTGRYAREQVLATYERLLDLSRSVLAAGYSVVVDATFLDAAWRARFAALAAERGAPFHILDCDAPEEVLTERIEARLRAGQDASEATVEVMRAQRARAEPLNEQERRVRVDAAQLDFQRANVVTLETFGSLRPGASA